MVVRNISDAFCYPSDFLDIATAGSDDLPGVSVDDIAEIMNEDSLSTAFSGIGSPEVANNVFHHELQLRLGSMDAVKKPKCLHMIEWDHEAQCELMLLGEEDDSCLFSDISQFWRPELRDIIDALSKSPSMSLEIIGPILSEGKAMLHHGNCLRHSHLRNGKRCCLKMAKRHIAGTSCTAYSSKGSRVGELDQTILHFLAWVGLRLHLQEPDICQENVFQFPTESLLVRFLGDMYYVDWGTLDPVDLGFPSARFRKWHRLRHRVKCLPSISPFSRFCMRFNRITLMSWKEYYFTHNHKHGAIQNEFETELNWSQQRQGSSAKDQPSLVESREDDAFWKSMTPTEQSYQQSYFQMWPEMAAQLNQDPKSNHRSKSSPLHLHTLIHNMGLIFYHKPLDLDDEGEGLGPSGWRGCRRWMFGTEALVSQAFPIHPRLHKGLTLTSFSKLRLNRKPRQVCAQAGNSMNVACSFLVQLHAYLCVKRVPILTTIQNIHLFTTHGQRERNTSLSSSSRGPAQGEDADSNAKRAGTDGSMTRKRFRVKCNG